MLKLLAVVLVYFGIAVACAFILSGSTKDK